MEKKRETIVVKEKLWEKSALMEEICHIMEEKRPFMKERCHLFQNLL
jgi:hypothetical protein